MPPNYKALTKKMTSLHNLTVWNKCPYCGKFMRWIAPDLFSCTGCEEETIIKY